MSNSHKETRPTLNPDTDDSQLVSMASQMIEDLHLHDHDAKYSDAQLAELLNWMLPNISAAQIPPNFLPYTEAEVTALRSSPEEDVHGTRQKLIKALRLLKKSNE